MLICSPLACSRTISYNILVARGATVPMEHLNILKGGGSTASSLLFWDAFHTGTALCTLKQGAERKGKQKQHLEINLPASQQLLPFNYLKRAPTAVTDEGTLQGRLWQTSAGTERSPLNQGFIILRLQTTLVLSKCPVSRLGFERNK